MKAKIEPDYIAVKHVSKYDGVTCCVVECENYDRYKVLPDTVSYNGVLCGKTGWNSDKNHAYFQSNSYYVRKVG